MWEESRLSAWLLASAWHSPGCCGHLGIELESRKKDISAFQIKIYHALFFIIILILNIFRPAKSLWHTTKGIKIHQANIEKKYTRYRQLQLHDSFEKLVFESKQFFYSETSNSTKLYKQGTVVVA